MNGVIQKVLLSLLEERGGDELKSRVLTRAGLSEATRFRINTDYSDEDFHRLTEASVAETGLTRAELMEAYAEHFIRYAESLFPRFFEMSTNARDFLIRQPVIHASLAAGLRAPEARQAVVDKFCVTSIEDGSLRIEYRSPNRLCDLYQALAYALAKRYGETLAVEPLQCGGQLESDVCILRVYWPQEHAPGAAVACCLDQGARP